MSTFTPLPCLIGGSFIGLASTTLLLLNGDIMGSSGILSPIVIEPIRTWNVQSWKHVFIASFVGTANLYVILVDPDAFQDHAAVHQLSTLGYLTAGLLVGFGTKLGSGCTCGHGICGLARFSRRSFSAVCTFMGAGIATATLVSMGVGQTFTQPLFAESPQFRNNDTKASLLFVTAPCVLAVGSVMCKLCKKTLGAALSGTLFAIGVTMSKMVIPSKVSGFMDLTGLSKGTYDPSLMFVMGGGLVVSILGYQYKHRYCNSKPLRSDEYSIPTNNVIDIPLLMGSVFFGSGLALGGFCPGPSIAQAAVGNAPIVYFWMPSFFAGSYLGSKAQDFLNTKKCNTSLKEISKM